MQIFFVVFWLSNVSSPRLVTGSHSASAHPALQAAGIGVGV
jgi:hypothetical protein